MENLFETIATALKPAKNNDYCYDLNHKTILCQDGIVRCLSCNLTKISAQHQ